MRQNRTSSSDCWGGSSTDSSEPGSYDDDTMVVSLHLMTEAGATKSVQKSYQGMVDMLDESLRVICVSERNEFHEEIENGEKEIIPSSKTAIPCLATVLFFNGNQQETSPTEEYHKTKAIGQRMNGLSKPDLLQNHVWNSTLDIVDFERDFKHPKDFNDNDLTLLKSSGRSTPSIGGKLSNASRCGRQSPFLRYDVILQESLEREKLTPTACDDGIVKDNYFDFDSSETTLDARKQLSTWPWEFHHRAGTAKGISQCQSNSQDFFAYQPVQEVTRLYGDVIDTSKISRRKNINALNGCEKDAFMDMLDNTADDLREVILNERNNKDRTRSDTDFPLMAVREVHYGRQHLRYTLFVSDTRWADQVEFYRLLLRRHEVTLRENFCFFTFYSGGKTDIQFALKKLSSEQIPIPLSSTLMQFKVHNVGHLVPLLPHACKPISDVRWQTRDHDGNAVLLEIQPRRLDSDTSSSLNGRIHTPLEYVVTSPSEVDGKQSSDDEYSLERLDSFVEPELPHRMPLLKPALYANISGSRFGRRTNCSPSPGSSSSNSPERKTTQYPYSSRLQRLYPVKSMDIGSYATLPTPRHSSTPTSWASRSRASESSDEPAENTNFYRRAKFKRDVRRKSEGSVSYHENKKENRTKSRATSKSRQKHRTQRTIDSLEDEIEVYV